MTLGINAEIVTIRMAHDQLYSTPAELVEKWDNGQALVRFAAGNIRLVDIDLLEPANEADKKEFVASQAVWKN